LIAYLKQNTWKDLMRSLEERIQAFEQKKARLAETEARLKLAEKKFHTRRLIVMGALMEKAGLSELADQTLYGALISARKGMDDPKTRDQWTTLGARTLEQESRVEDEQREPIVLTFPEQPSKELTTYLRTAGYRFNKILRHWEGVGEYEQAKDIAAAHNGLARKHSVEEIAPKNAALNGQD
jgi:hypothetical protein